VDKTGYYYMFGFLAVVSFILLVTIVEVSVVATYLQLCSEVNPLFLPSQNAILDILTACRITTGGGSRSLLAPEAPFGSSYIVHGTTLFDCILLVLCQACCSSHTVCWLVLCTVFLRALCHSSQAMHLSGGYSSKCHSTEYISLSTIILTLLQSDKSRLIKGLGRFNDHSSTYMIVITVALHEVISLRMSQAFYKS
jgi:hypothetical protein